VIFSGAYRPNPVSIAASVRLREGGSSSHHHAKAKFQSLCRAEHATEVSHHHFILGGADVFDIRVVKAARFSG